VGVAIPQSIFSNLTGNRTTQEMVSTANEMAQRITADHRDWTRLRKVQTYTGDGVTTAWDLPANYRRMLLTSNVWRSTSTEQPMAFISDTEDWLNRRYGNATDNAWGEWTMLGGQIHLWPALAVDETAYFAYLDRNCVALASGGFSDSFLADLDRFVLDERLLKLGMILDWKQKKGSAYAEDMGTYQDALENAAGRDQPAPIIGSRMLRSTDASIAIPTQTIFVPG